jgi:hypothetical protein
MGQRDVGKNPLKRFQPPFDKFSGISRSHSEHPEIEENFHKGMTGHFMLHYQYYTAGQDDAFHFF